MKWRRGARDSKGSRIPVTAWGLKIEFIWKQFTTNKFLQNISLSSGSALQFYSHLYEMKIISNSFSSLTFFKHGIFQLLF